MSSDAVNLDLEDTRAQEATQLTDSVRRRLENGYKVRQHQHLLDCLTRLNN